MISSEARRSIIGGIEAVLLGCLHVKAIVEPRPPGKDTVLAQCVAATMTKEAGKEQGGGNSSTMWIVTLIDHGAW